jgi:hypothetical protein
VKEINNKGPNIEQMNADFTFRGNCHMWTWASLISTALFAGLVFALFIKKSIWWAIPTAICGVILIVSIIFLIVFTKKYSVDYPTLSSQVRIENNSKYQEIIDRWNREYFSDVGVIASIPLNLPYIQISSKNQEIILGNHDFPDRAQEGVRDQQYLAWGFPFGGNGEYGKTVPLNVRS